MTHQVLRSAAYAKLSPHAVKLLNDLLAQYNGKNNGDLCCAWSMMEKRHWKSKDTLYKAIKELKSADWLEVSRQGGRHKPTLYALTFFAVDECNGKLDIPSTKQPKSTWKIKSGSPSAVPIKPELVRDAYQ